MGFYFKLGFRDVRSDRAKLQAWKIDPDSKYVDAVDKQLAAIREKMADKKLAVSDLLKLGAEQKAVSSYMTESYMFATTAALLLQSAMSWQTYFNALELL